MNFSIGVINKQGMTIWMNFIDGVIITKQKQVIRKLSVKQSSFTSIFVIKC